MERRGGQRNRTERFEEEALREILAVERQAQGIIHDAEAETQRIALTAQQRARDLKAQAQVQSQELAELALRQATSAIEQETWAIQQQADDEAQNWIREAETHYANALAHILDVITGASSDMDEKR
jgi:vacuolar-type H+-ATPase subunit H